MPTKTTSRAASTKYKDTMRAEYDLTGGVRGKYYGKVNVPAVKVVLDSDIAEVFQDSAQVNEALRPLIKAAKAGKPAA